MLGASEDVDRFVGEFIKKRKATEYLVVGAENLRRFEPDEIRHFKGLFKQVSLVRSSRGR